MCMRDEEVWFGFQIVKHMGLKDSLRDEHDRSGAELHGCTLC
jgi:hypothetical protein